MSRNPRSPVLDSIESEIEMTADDSNPMDDDAACKRYVVLVAPGEQLPPPLMELLTDRTDDSVNANVFQANHPLMAISLLARLERERRLRRKWELDEQTVLVVANRDSWGDLSGLFNATRQHMPAVPIWTVIETHALQIYAGEPEEQDPDAELVPEDEYSAPEDEQSNPEDEHQEETDRTPLSRDEFQELLEALDFEEDREEDREDDSKKDDPEPEPS